MKNMKIKPRLLVSYMVIVLFMVIAGGYGITAITMASNSTQLLNARATSAILSGNLESNLNRQRALGRDSALASTLVWNVPSIFEGNVAQLSVSDAEFNTVVTQLENLLLTEGNEEIKVILNDIISNYQKFRTGCDNLIMVLKDDTSTPGQVVAALDDSTPPYNDAIASIQKLSGFLDRMTNEQASAAAAQAKLITTVMIVGIIIVMTIAIILSLYISGAISKPLVTISGFLKKASATGDLTFRPEDEKNIENLAKTNDEISLLATSLAGFLSRISDVSRELEMVACGNLSTKLALLSEKDLMGLSLQKMIENLNRMFGEINASSEQVSTGSKQIADGAQSLARGATAQASAIEELSASISEIADKTKQNANVAREAAELSGSIKDNAEKGDVQMDQMMQAVREINEASGEISKVIKVIDDIAFQTNILALNAAVEAARAGQHGKGFAVVAEEVRNLAAKSAEAAKDTSGLIENSIEKANLGLKIATETSASLKEIVEGINRNVEIVAQIARSSDEQAGAIAQINIGIDQVAQVVQQNSATAEESAAASEEMSGQSDMLAQLISQFRLRDNNFKQQPIWHPTTIPEPSFTLSGENVHMLSGGYSNLGKY